MFWKITAVAGTGGAGGAGNARFVLHRHHDSSGPHLDLRLEQDGHLLGWRIDALTLEGAPWAAEKSPHPLHWLDADGDAVREDSGTYAWIHQDADLKEVQLFGRNGCRILRAERVTALTPQQLRAFTEALAALGVRPDDVPGLLADGLTARRRSIERLCGLGRELDGDAFNDPLWRKTLDALPLSDIHLQLRAYEARFDAKYPPQPVSRPEPLSDHESPRDTQAALAILRE